MYDKLRACKLDGAKQVEGQLGTSFRHLTSDPCNCVVTRRKLISRRIASKHYAFVVREFTFFAGSVFSNIYTNNIFNIEIPATMFSFVDQVIPFCLNS